MRISRIVICLTFAGSLFFPCMAGAQQQNPVQQQNQAHQQSPTDTASSVQDKCTKNKDHAACLKYYRAGCIAKDPQACNDYAKEISADCGTTPSRTAPPEVLSAYLDCSRKVQCWQDRAIALPQMLQACNQNSDSDQCKTAKRRFATVSPSICDGSHSESPVF
jgi:hypothetical protein